MASYIFSFSKISTSSRMALHLCIFLLDAFIILGCVNFFIIRSKFGWVFIGFSAFVLLLHVDYLYARLHYFQGIMGNPVSLKIYIVIAQYFIVFVFLLSRMIRGKSDFKWFDGRKYDFILLGLPCTPLITYYSHNLEFFTTTSAMIYFVILIVIPIGFFLVLQLIQNMFNMVKIAAPMISSFFFVYYSRPIYTSLSKTPIENSGFHQLSILFITTAVIVFVYLKARRALLIFVAVLFVISITNSCVIVNREKAINSSIAVDRPVSANCEKKLPHYLASIPRQRPDIYLLIYDAYANQKMMYYYGIDNNAQTNYLKTIGFKIYDDTYALGLGTIDNMSRVLDMDNLPKNAIGENNTVNAFLKRAGYKTHLVLYPYILGYLPIFAADYVYPPFFSRNGVSAVFKGIAGGEFKSTLVFLDTNYKDWLRAKREVISSVTDHPKFLYAHSHLPGHSQNSGRCREDETALYFERLQQANHEMRRDISEIIATNRDVIIVIAGDHGPYLTADCSFMEEHKESDIAAVDLADRYGMFLSIKWPDQSYREYDQISILQDVFFSVFSYMLKDEKVLDHKLIKKTVGGGKVLRSGAIKDGIVNIGKDKGKMLYDSIPKK